MFITAALAFYLLVAFVPLLFMAFWVLTMAVGSSATAQMQLQAFLSQYLVPTATELVLSRVRSLADHGLLSIFGAWWGVLAFFWSGIHFFELLQNALATAWGGLRTRPFWHRKVMTLATFAMSWLLGGLGFIAMMWLVALVGRWRTLFGFAPHIVLVAAVHVLSLAFSVLMLALMYRYMPVAHVPWRMAFLTALPAGIIWEVSRRIFTAMVVEGGLYTSVYGPVAGLMALVLWVYLSAVIVIFGAEFGAAWQAEFKPAAS